MSEIVSKIKEDVINRSIEHEKKTGYNYFENHIKYVVKNALELAEKYGADIEVVEIGALLHDSAAVYEYGPIEEHNVYGEKLADKMLSDLNYDETKKELVKKCVLNHRSSTKLNRNTIEEKCVADADVIAHFDRIPDLFSLAYHDRGMTILEGANYVKGKLERDFNKLSDESKVLLKDRYENIMKVLFN